MLKSACTLVREDASQAFARLYDRGFQITEPSGPYPRITVVRRELWSMAIDFWMSLDERGKYQTQWRHDVPFELGGSASIRRNEGSHLVSYWKKYLAYDDRPYNVALQTLEEDVANVANVLENWDEATILDSGERVVARRAPRTI